MADVQSNINVNIDTSSALASIKLLQAQMSAFHTSMAKGTATSANAASQLQQKLIDSVNATGKFSAGIQTIKTTTESFTSSLEKNKFSLGQYFKYSVAATKSFGGAFKTEMATIDKVARERVKDLQTQYIQLGRDANGAMKAIAVRPLMLDLDSLQTKTALAAQKQQILNQLLKQGSTNLLNFGKNTQWAGRQLMVGFSIPLAMAGTAAAKAYMEIEKASIQIKRVYGDLNTTAQETNNMVGQIKNLAAEYTKYGVAIADTMAMAAKAAAMGKTGADLLAQVNQASKLSVLGGVDQNTALDTTISLTNAFGIEADKLSSKINFLNAVENQTVLSIEDMTTAIPKAAPVVKQLGGGVEDLAFFLTAMKEGGINASEGANALKSGLSALINPSKKASEFLAGFGINVKAIVEGDKGNLKKTVVDFASALDKINPLDRARAIEMMFGKFQFARISTLLQNVNKEGSQAAKALGLANMSSIQLAAISRRELDKLESSPMYKFQKAMADLQLKIAPIGETFLKAVTPVLNSVSDFLGGFNKMGDGFKQFVVVGAAILGGLAPVLLMVVGLVANGAANIIKMFANVKAFLNKTSTESQVLGETTNYLTTEQIKAEAVAASLDQTHTKLKQTFTSEASAVMLLMGAYERASAAMAGFMSPGIPTSIVPRSKLATGGIVRGPGSGTSDSIPAMLSNGEAVIPAASVARNPELTSALVAGNIRGFADGVILGRGRSRQTPGGAELSHFNTSDFSPRMMGAEILAEAARLGEAHLASWTKKLTAQAEKLGISFEEILDREFKVYNNKVVVMSAELNNLLKPSGGGVAAGVVQKEFSAAGQQVHGYVAKQLQDLNVDSKEISLIIEQLTERTNLELSKFSADTKITEKELSDALDIAYKDIAAGNKNLEIALQKMGRIAYFDSLVPGKSRSGGTRIQGSPDAGYRSQVSESITTGASFRPGQDSFYSTVSKRYYNVEAHLEIYDKLIQTHSADLRRINEIEDATLREKELELLAIKAGITTEDQLSAAKQRQIQMLSGSVVTSQSTSGLGSAGIVAAGLERSAGIASPSKRLYKDGEFLFLGLHGGLMKNLQKIKVAGESFGTAAVKTMTTITPAMQSYLNQWGGKLVAPYIKAQGSLIPAGLERVVVLNEEQKALKKATTATQQDVIANEEDALAKMQDVSASEIQATKKPKMLDNIGGGKAFGYSMAASAAVGALAMIPGAVGEFASSLMPLVSTISMVVPALAMMGVSLSAAIPPILAIGAAIGAGILIYKSVNDAKQKELESIQRMTNAYKNADSAMSAFGTLTGTTPNKSLMDVAKVGVASRGGKQASDVATLLSSTDFKDKTSDVGKVITDIKAMSETQASAFLQTYSNKLRAAGFSENNINSLMRALEIAAGKRTLNLQFADIQFGSKGGTSALEKQTKDAVDKYKKSAADASKEQQRIQKQEENKQERNSRAPGAPKLTAKESQKEISARVKVLTGANSVIKSSQANFKSLSTSVATNLSSMVQQVGAGMISLKGYSSSLDGIKASLTGLTKTDKSALIASMLLGPDGQQLMTNAKMDTLSYNQQLGLLQMYYANPESAAKIVKTITAGGDAAINAAKDLGLYNAAVIAAASKDYQKDVGTLQGPGTQKETPFSTGIKSIKEQTQAIKDQVTAFNKLRLAGYDAEKAYKISSDSATAAALASQKVGSAGWKQIISLLKSQESEQKKADAALAKTLEGKTKAFEDAYSKIQEAFSAYEEQANAAFQINNKADLDIITQAESKIAGLQYKLDGWQSSLDSIQLKEDAINESYDKKIAALDTVASINEKIVKQQQSQLTIADAITKGDISAAAAAIQSQRSEQASASAQDQKTLLEQARKNDLAGVSVNGQTRLQIETQIKSITADIKKIEDESLKPAQERVRLAQEKLDADTKAHIVAGKTKDEWSLVAGNINLAKTNTDEFVKSIIAGIDAAKQLNAALASKTTNTVAANVTNALKTGGSYAVPSGGVIAGGNFYSYMNQPPISRSAGGMVPQYFANGGSPFAIGTDTVPAMLTPGEFVVNRYAVDNFGVDKLKAINSGNYSGESVYNSYELNVNVRSDANPNDIARTVMAQIKHIDSQRVRGVRL